MKAQRKVVSFLLITMAVVLQCITSFAQLNNGFNLYGYVKGLKNGENLHILIKKGNEIDTVSSAIAKNHHFVFRNVKLPVIHDFYMITIQSEFVKDLRLFLDQTGDVKIKGNLSNWPDVEILGSEAHEGYLNCEILKKELRAKDFLVKYPGGSAPADTVTTYVLKELKEMIRQRPDSYYLAYAIVNLVHKAAASGHAYTPDMKKNLYEMLSPKVKASHYGRILGQQIADYGIKKVRLAQLKAAVQGLSTINSAEALEQLKVNAAVKVPLSRLAPSSKSLTETQLKDKLEQATIIVNMAYMQGEEIKSNPTTAYVIDEGGVCVTNYHVGKEYSTKPYLSLSVMTKEGKSYPVTKILSCSESDDLMVFQVDTKGSKLVALPLGNIANRGAAIHVMGHPNSNFYRYSSGVISSYDTSSLAGQACNTMSITAYFNVGSSGGPIVDDCGNIVGTVSRMTDSGERIGIPVSELKKLIEFKK